MARKYQKVQALLPEIQRMLDSGMSQREVAEALGLEGDRPIHNLLKRERKKNVQGMPKQRGRKPARTLQEYKYENKRLKMENELLRDLVLSCLIRSVLRAYFIDSAVATATATVAPTMGLLPMPRKPIISTCAGTEEEPAN